MAVQFPYLFGIIVFIFLPTLSMWIFYSRYLRKHLSLFIHIGIISLIWGLASDLTGSVWWKIWFYEHTLGVYFLHLPLEEYLTLIIFPQEVVVLLLIVRKYLYE